MMHWQKLTLLTIIASATIAKPVWSNEAASTTAAPPLYSEAFCLKVFEEVIDKARSSTWQISDRDRHILTQCKAKFPANTTAKTPLPTATECLEIVKTLVREGLSKVKEMELPEERAQALARCDEVIKYQYFRTDNMLPTIEPGERLVIDKTVDRTQSPQRGDIIVFVPIEALPLENSQEPSVRRTIGLPGERVKIERGKIYINGKLLQGDYIKPIPTNRSASLVVPPNSYFTLDDNHQSTANKKFGSIVSRSEISGKVIWHFKN